MPLGQLSYSRQFIMLIKGPEMFGRQINGKNRKSLLKEGSKTGQLTDNGHTDIHHFG